MHVHEQTLKMASSEVSQDVYSTKKIGRSFAGMSLHMQRFVANQMTADSSWHSNLKHCKLLFHNIVKKHKLSASREPSLSQLSTALSHLGNAMSKGDFLDEQKRFLEDFVNLHCLTLKTKPWPSNTMDSVVQKMRNHLLEVFRDKYLLKWACGIFGPEDNEQNRKCQSYCKIDALLYSFWRILFYHHYSHQRSLLKRCRNDRFRNLLQASLDNLSEQAANWYHSIYDTLAQTEALDDYVLSIQSKFSQSNGFPSLPKHVFLDCQILSPVLENEKLLWQLTHYISNVCMLGSFAERYRDNKVNALG